MCHGGTQNQTGAPPKPTWGNTSVVAVGAHSRHVGTNPVSAPIACVECHVTPVDALAASHVNGAATVVFAGPVSGISGGTWNYPVNGTPTCSSTFCHGDFVGGKTTYAPNWTSTASAACGSCHNARPLGYLHKRHQDSDYTYAGIPWWPLAGGSGWVTCQDCHLGIASSTTRILGLQLTVVNGSGPPLHVNGVKDVVFRNGGTWDPQPYQGTCSNMACHPGEVKQWPR
jgi:predicted CxxxxCH...CXXCH cytochrome family protein